MPNKITFEMKSNVFNNKISGGNPFSFPNLSEGQERIILSELFEQIMLFDKTTIRIDRHGFPLYFLIKNIGINPLEELIEKNIISFLMWTPVIVSTTGREREDKSIDESAIYGIPPIVPGAISNEDRDPEKNVDQILSKITMHRDRKRIFKRKVLKNYVIPEGIEFSTESANLVIDSYKQNNLAELGLPFDREPESLNVDGRKKLLKLSSYVLETAILSKYGMKSFENYEHYKICEQNLKNIGSALSVSENASKILEIENIPNLKKLYLEENLNFESALKLRYKSNAKHFRKWINEVSAHCDANKISKEYLNEVKGNNNFFDSTAGKFIRTIGSFGMGEGVGSALTGINGTIAGLGLGLLDTFVLDGILKGRNPSMFISDLEKEIKKENS